MLCSITTTATPRPLIRRTIATTARRSARSRPATGSSSSRTRGSAASARAISRRRRSARPSVPARRVAPILEAREGEQLGDAGGGPGALAGVTPAPGERVEQAGAGADVEPGRHVAGDAELAEGPRGLEGAGHAEGRHPAGSEPRRRDAADLDPAGRGSHQAADHVEQRALSGAVRADEADQLARVHLEADVARAPSGRRSGRVTPRGPGPSAGARAGSPGAGSA